MNRTEGEGQLVADSKAQALMKSINATLKTDALQLANDSKYTTRFVPTNILPIDVLLGGGIPRGRFIELYGDYSTLKSYVGLMSIAEHQRRGMVCAVIDTEHSFDEEWARSCGVKTTDLIIDRPLSGELAMDKAELLIRGKADLIVFDSIAAMAPQTELGKRMHDENIQPARIAALMSAGLRRLTTVNSDTSMIFINQTRVNLGITFGSNDAQPGGKAMGFYASYRVNMKKVGKITEDRRVFDYDSGKYMNVKRQIGQKFKAELTKSKLSKPFQEEWFDWNLNTGSLDMVSYMIAQGMEHGIIEVSGTTWLVNGTKVAVGKPKFRKAVEAAPDLLLEIENGVRAARGLTVTTAPTVRNQVTSKGRQGGASVLARKKGSTLRRK